MSGINELKEMIRSEVVSARNRVHASQVETGEHFRQMQARYRAFLDVSHQIRDALRPRVEAFAEALPEVTPIVSRREFGPAGRGFHAVFVSFTIPRSERCPATVDLRFGLEAGPAVENLVLSYDLEILPVFMEFERHDRTVLPLGESSVEQAVAWFDRKAITFTRTYLDMLFNPHYQQGTDVADVVLGMSFPRNFARGQTEHRGSTYYFFTEESREAFVADPARYVGDAQTS